MFTGRKIILEKPTKADAFYFQKWFMNKEFRHWYDSYMSVSLDMIEAEIAQVKDVTDPSAERIDFAVKNKRNGETIGIASIKDIGMPKLRWALAMKKIVWPVLVWI